MRWASAWLVVIVASLAGCPSNDRPSCAAVAVAFDHIASADPAPGAPTGLAAARLRRALVDVCEQDHWSGDVLACYARIRSASDVIECNTKLSIEQKRHMAELAKAAVKPDATSPAKPASPNTITSPLPEVGPHPDYPTPVSAGTDKIFTLEDPERGPKAPLAFAIPRASLSWTTYAHCEDDLTTVACSGVAGHGGTLQTWRVGRKGKELLVAELLLGKRVVEAFVVEAKPDGTPIQRLHIDAYDRVESALLFGAPGRYSGRLRTGANALGGCGSIAYTLDSAGRSVEERCLQWLGDPMRDTHGVAIHRYVRDAHGFVVETQALGIDRKPIANDHGVATTKLELDPDGRVVVERYFDDGGRPVASTAGCYGERTARDPHGVETSTTCLDAGDQPTAGVTGIAITTYKNDARGCRVGLRNLTADQKPATTQAQVHGEDLEVDDHCATVVRTCLDVVEQPLACGPSAPAKQVYRRDPHGNVVSMKSYGPEGRASGDAEFHVAEMRWQYDDRGNVIGESCHDDGGTAVSCARTGFHAKKIEFDDAGRAVNEQYFDARGAATTNLGAAIHRFSYDNYDHQFESRSFDADGKVIEVFGNAVRRDLYDPSHRRFAVILLDRDAKAARYTGCYTGATCPHGKWHAVRIVRRVDGTAAKNMFFDEDGQLLQTFDCRTTQCFD